ncbi:hybrid sensor histidine kinase/response regulator [Shewanella sp. CG12_big_fil_rev_8_21_14_0_65_47_15]|uniref:hybrid sensor histidine kinase/response regulator n=1 Tax=Shewanella sp. CG12_big_fil_rev_8_21_14_0_65_47_15 TaxID=1975537 RepID=UPI000CB05D0D|nr:hybrid sensor histidine kinase/response regulator [Shewanella sp. CG12_big_fil_rev_8_21_14_0_65_47_15]PIW59440.1 MAG: hypothetical protein COW15_17550 [Shewanella sp. CG12_big_fil_rev_8_21_14_0_65_47_15]
MSIVDLNLFNSCAFMLSPKGEWLSENYAFSIDAFLSNSKKLIYDHFNTLKDNLFPDEYLRVNGKYIRFKILETITKDIVVFCNVINDSQVNNEFEYNQPNKLEIADYDCCHRRPICSDAFILINKLGYIELINEKIESIFPYLYGEFYAGKQFFTLITDIVNHEYQFISRDSFNVLQWFEFKLKENKRIQFLFKTESGFILEYRDVFFDDGSRFGLLIDRTEKYKRAEAIKQEYSLLIQFNENQSDFIATLGHEIRTPLNAVLGLIELSLGSVRAQDRPLLSIAFSTSKQVLSLINNMLNFKRGRDDRLEIAHDVVDIRRLGESIVDAFSVQADKKNINLDFYMPLNFRSKIICDEVKLSQVIYNLISNAMKFSGENSASVLLTIDVLEKTFDSAKLKFSVIDNGIGLTEDEQSKVFGKYEQVSSDAYSKHHGIGLGLYISKNICHSMGGDLKVISKKGEGSIFYFVLEFMLDDEDVVTVDDNAHVYKSDNLVRVYTNSPLFYTSVSRYSQETNFELLYLSSSEMILVDIADGVFFIDLNQSDIVSMDEFLAYLSPRGECVAELRKVSFTESYLDCEIILYPPLKMWKVIDFINDKDRLSCICEVDSDEVDYNDICVLVIDDCQENLFVIEKQLLSLGVKATCVQDPIQAIELFKVNNFNVVISDVVMPTIYGVDLVSVIRDVENYRELTPSIIIMLTAEHGDDCKDECLQAGANRVLVKPLALSELECLLDDVKATFPHHTKSHFVIAGNDSNIEENDFVCFDEHDVTLCEMTPQSQSMAQLVNFSEIYKFVGEDISDEELETFLEQYYSNLIVKREALKSAIMENDFLRISTISHTLKSNSLFVGAKKLNLSCQELENISRDNTVDYNALLDCWQEVDDDLFTLTEFFIQRSNQSGQS